MFKKSYKFSDIAIYQKENICKSRLDTKIKSEIIRGVIRPLPLLAANMSTVTNAEFSIGLYRLGAMGVLHRAFPNTDDYISETKKITKEIPSVAVSIGIKDSDYILVEKLIKAGSNIIFVDVAHGFNKYALQMCQHIKKFYPTIKVVAGNTINPDMIGMFNDYVDAIKIGIGGGNSCSTATVVGCTKNQFSAIYDLKEISQKYGMPIISDGNIRCPADFTKAIGAGASCAMAGSIFARCPESASETIEIDGIKKKILAGMSCYSDDTEILTINGWKNFSEIKLSDDLATLNTETKLMEFQKPTNIFNYNYNGEMININHKAIDLLVTPNHRMYVAKRARIKDGYKEKFKFVKAERCCKENFKYQKICGWKGEYSKFFKIPDVVSGYKNKYKKIGTNFLTEEWIDFFGFWLAEGWANKRISKSKKHISYNPNHFVYSISISNNNKKLINHYVTLLRKYNIGSFVRKRNKNYELTIQNMPLCSYLMKFGKAHEKFIPKKIKNLPTKLLEILINSIFLGDGCKNRNSITSSSTKFIDDISEICIKCGLTPTIHLNHPKGSLGEINGKSFVRKYDSFSVYVGKYWHNPTILPKHYSFIDYSGKVYCAEVPNGILCVRRNNKYTWCGNSEYVQNKWKGGLKPGTSAEGKLIHLDIGEPVESLLNRYAGALRSAISYAGFDNIQDFQRGCEFILI